MASFNVPLVDTSIIDTVANRGDGDARELAKFIKEMCLVMTAYEKEIDRLRDRVANLEASSQ